MNISAKDWKNYINKLSALDRKAGELMQTWIQKNGLENRDALIEYAYAVATKYGEGSAALTAEMYDAIAELSGDLYPAAEVAATPSYGEVAKSVNGTLKHSQNPNSVSNVVSRLVKRTGADTMLKNAERDGAQFAWVPNGDTCAFCIALASRGWQYMSKKALKNGHAEHIHANCDCTYAVRFNSKDGVKGYDPQKYEDMYYGAEGGTPNERINSLRRMRYAEHKDAINAQKRAAYAVNVSNAMKKNAETMWGGLPTNNSPEEIDELRKYAERKSIVLDKSFTSFDGDLSLIEDFVDKMNECINANEHMRNKQIKLSLSYTLEDDVYAITHGSSITINGFAFRDRGLLDSDYQDRVAAGWFTKGSTYKDIATHESAHVIVYLDQLKTKGVAESVYGRNTTANYSIIRDTISEYATKNDSELIAESYVMMRNGTKDEGVFKVLSYCGILKQ